MGCPIMGLCQCSNLGMCPFCKVLAIALIAFLSGYLGFRIGRRKGCSKK